MIARRINSCNSATCRIAQGDFRDKSGITRKPGTNRSSELTRYAVANGLIG